jgi:hypothetical protein
MRKWSLRREAVEVADGDDDGMSLSVLFRSAGLIII